MQGLAGGRGLGGVWVHGKGSTCHIKEIPVLCRKGLLGENTALCPPLGKLGSVMSVSVHVHNNMFSCDDSNLIIYIRTIVQCVVLRV